MVDVDGTRQAARQRALPQTEALPAPRRRFNQVCAPGYLGRKRGEVVRTRTVLLQAHTHQFLGTFGGSGNGDYRSELRRAVQVITTYATHLALPLASVLLRLDGLYGDAAPLHLRCGCGSWSDCQKSCVSPAGGGGGQAGACTRSESGEYAS
jgi:hypothetical protein